MSNQSPTSETKHSLVAVVRSYFEFRKYTEPNTNQAMLFLISEIGELSDTLVHGQSNWVRNHPDDKNGDQEAIASEIADCLMMLTKFADTLGIDPMEAMVRKMVAKGWQPNSDASQS